jgi:hypothetical protein
MDLQHIPLSNLKIANVNVRHARKPPDVSDIPPSIRARRITAAADPAQRRGLRNRRRTAALFRSLQGRGRAGVAATEVLLPVPLLRGATMPARWRRP